ncbi:hypothetical protein RFI_04737 [Reticulomyxa filosa]|uniref:tRNA pseudouridine synthase n=1 Tax=Reticulomyxa filosa TaxID=46433 RepID=X6P2P9_RETFI|nr:hypothetical protein RFI_04737 [Reticulomyxa filosa]|eukprot:ETO32383.1 hypothetical protein RFI_04737 [Reticulomyxa filosa]
MEKNSENETPMVSRGKHKLEGTLFIAFFFFFFAHIYKSIRTKGESSDPPSKKLKLVASANENEKEQSKSVDIGSGRQQLVPVSRTDKEVHAAGAVFTIDLSNLFEKVSSTPCNTYSLSVPSSSPVTIATTSETNECDIVSSPNTICNSDNSSSKKEVESVETKSDSANFNSNSNINNITNNSNDNNNNNNNNDNNNNTNDWTQMINYINGYLPSDIRIQNIIRTTKTFDPYKHVSSRVYRYICPTYVFNRRLVMADDNTLESNFTNLAEYSQCFQKYGKDSKKDDSANIIDMQPDSKEQSSETKAIKLIVEKDIRKDYRMSEEEWQELVSLCHIFNKGTRNYHNFTKQINAEEGRAKRYMLEFSITKGKPLVYQGIEFVEFHIHGSSFMYNQIRKMIAFLVCLMHHNCMGVSPLPQEPWELYRTKIIETAFSDKHKVVWCAYVCVCGNL